MTRQWGIDPELLCRQHLLGEHREMHQEVGHINADNLATVKGHARCGQVDTSSIQERHDELVEEMHRRGYNHQSPLEYDDELELGYIDLAENLADLADRCEDCRGRMEDADVEIPDLMHDRIPRRIKECRDTNGVWVCIETGRYFRDKKAADSHAVDHGLQDRPVWMKRPQPPNGREWHDPFVERANPKLTDQTLKQGPGRVNPDLAMEQ
ncbi:hypothetical protein G3I44_14315 [Halogeometricum borinquense]|uniref:Uncharacterized protein n=1 Tax=Halogeometricum borinquense TaxID=60847 RepID=A0A6C0UJJ7_9EURY|nr:pyrimidine dimer DNA glycosylase/endonuclease V [Halogeometricum borinquense]QIB75360.1 hypothetical protein G3I44_14315 [Halogeometricum borinquense]